MVRLKEITISVTCKKRANYSKHRISIKNIHKPIITRENFMLIQELIKIITKQKITNKPIYLQIYFLC